jgi:FlaA1/EpsC-like NDP-sugar epimerase
METRHLHNNTAWVQRALLLALLDTISIMGSYFFALLLRFNFTFSMIDPYYIAGFLKLIIPCCIITLAVFYCCRLYHSVWTFAGVKEVISIINAYLILIPAYIILAWCMNLHMPRSYYVMGYIVNFCLTTGMRFSYRVFRTQIQNLRKPGKDQERIMIIGAGAAGQMLIRDLQYSAKVNSTICCVIDDNPNKKGRILEGVLIVGGCDEIPAAAKRYRIDLIVLSIPTLGPERRREILEICRTIVVLS